MLKRSEISEEKATASAERRYNILAALPDMPITDRISDVSRFILSKKDKAYFE